MRIPGVLLLLLAVLATVAYPQIDEQLSAHVQFAAAVDMRTSGKDQWRYSKHAPFHAFLGKAAQEFTSTDPEETAGRVCTELGGDIGYVASAGKGKTRLGFLCRFIEPDVTMHIDFGELDRIPAN